MWKGSDRKEEKIVRNKGDVASYIQFIRKYKFEGRGEEGNEEKGEERVGKYRNGKKQRKENRRGEVA